MAYLGKRIEDRIDIESELRDPFAPVFSIEDRGRATALEVWHSSFDDAG